MSSIQCFVALILCAVLWISASNGSLTPKSLENHHVIIASPDRVHALLTSPDTIVVVWHMPPIYVPHDVSSEKFAQLKRGDKIDVMEPKINHVAVKDNETVSDSESAGDNPSTLSPEGSLSDKDASGSQDKLDEEDPANLTPVICRVLSFFANDTIGEKKATTADNGWSVTLLGSDIPIEFTNTTLFYHENKHKIVKFEEGCLTKMVVSYKKLHSRHEDIKIVLNSTDRLVTIGGLKPQTTYEITVTAHYLSGDALSSKPYFATSLAEGAEGKCLCDWHGTKNLTESCTNPSKGEKHCDCNDMYTGRFCEKCDKGFYRDMPSDGCKKCPCDEHAAVETSCHFVQGYLHCDKCAVGYTGNACHKCDKGYFRMGSKCKLCDCNGNTRPDAPLTCHPSTGACIDCQYNTTGYFCNRCLPGYRRDPPTSNGTCMRLTDLGADTSPPPKPSSSDSSSMSSGVIGAIIFVAILCVTVLVGIVVCKRVRENRQRRALWTVEMRPDNDDLDFNTVHNDEAHMDDMDFYEKQGRRAKSSGKYSKLTEDC